MGEGAALAGRVQVSRGYEAMEGCRLIVALSGNPKAVTAVAEAMLELEPWLDETSQVATATKQHTEPQATE